MIMDFRAEQQYFTENRCRFQYEKNKVQNFLKKRKVSPDAFKAGRERNGLHIRRPLFYPANASVFTCPLK